MKSIALALLLSGCATCQNHPYVCAAGTAIVVGSIAASVQHHHDQTQSTNCHELGQCHTMEMRP